MCEHMPLVAYLEPKRNQALEFMHLPMFLFEVFIKLCNGRKMGVSVNSRYFSLYRIRRGKGVTLIRQEGQRCDDSAIYLP